MEKKNMIETTNQLWLQENNVMLNVHFISKKKLTIDDQMSCM